MYLVEEHGEVNHAKLGERALEQAVANTQVRGRWKQMVEGGRGGGCTGNGSGLAKVHTYM